MPKAPLDKLLELLVTPSATVSRSSHIFLSLQPEEAFQTLHLAAKARMKETEVVYYDGQLCAQSPEPFYPLGTELRSQLKNPDLTGVYLPHKNLWTGLFSGELLERDEPRLASEVGYELSRIREDFNRLWDQQPAQSRIVFVDRVHRLSPSLWQTLTLGLNTSRNQVWVWHVPLDYQPEDPRDKPVWETFVRSVENRLLEYQITDVPAEIRRSEPTQIHDLDQILLTLDRCAAFLDLHQTRLLGDLAQSLIISQPKLKINRGPALLKMHMTLAETQLLSGELDRSVATLHQAQALAQELKNPKEEARILLRLGQVYQKRNHYTLSNQHTLQALSLAKKLHDPDLEAEVLLPFTYQAQDEGFIQDHYEDFEALRQRMETRGWKNHQAAIQTSITFLSAAIRKSSLTQAIRYCEEGIALCQELNNRYCLSVAYHARGVIAQSEFNYGQALSYYQKSEKIRRTLGDRVELIKICNGTGFFCLITQQFDAALVYFGKALKLLEQERDFRELGMTLFNMGLTYFFSFQHEKAQIFFQNLLSLMNLLDMENLPFQSRRQIHSLVGLCQLKEGRTQEAWQSYYRSEQYPVVDDPVHTFFHLLLKAWLTSSVDDWNTAFALANQKNYAIISYYFAADWGQFNLEVLKSGRQIQIWEAALGEISLFEGTFYSHRFQDLLEGKKPTQPSWKLKLPNFSALLQSANQEKTILSLQKKMDEIRFLANLQKHFEEAKDQDSLLSGVLSLIRQSFVVETGLIVLRGKEGRFITAGAFSPPENVDLLALHQVLFTHAQPQYFPRVGAVAELAGFKDRLASLIFLPLVHDDRYLGAMILGSLTRTLGLREEDLIPLSIAASQTASALDYLSNHEQLLAAVPKDELTGLPSRQELRRRPLKDKTGVLYIHLDNFRSYNDRYGRAVGDLVLQKFAGLLHIASRQEDLVVRYGGVEFVILVPDTGVEGAKKLAQRILREMKTRNNFQDALETFLGRQVDLGEADRLSCSIGVSELQGTQSLEEALAKVKNEGKGNFYEV